MLEHRGGRSTISFGRMWWDVQFSATLKGGVKPFYNRGLILHKQFSIVGI